MKIATWNVNSIKARLPNVVAWLKKAAPDVALLQELKTVEDGFPFLELEELGYNCAVAGQKSYNGVAVLSKHPIEIETKVLPGNDSDEQARYLEAFTGGIRVASIYLPNGNPTPGEKFDYKLAWMARLIEHARGLMALDEAVILGGDYNVCPTDADVFDPAGWADDALCRPESRARFRELLWLGYTEAFRTLHPDAARAWSFWDYQRGAWQQDNGVRIDHLLLSPMAADRLVACEIDKGPRGQQKASDHTPVWCELED
ncbi:MAG: exodeoxyribonuclease III [Alphaproteobacteria bacterium]|jgi:exodeoxyribonuclease III|nr:exodeoxyribonuclease III [Rhodospirillaceae bacterium]MBT6205487.1 exodeoxyribonuclease III [Rhodospirillaceae bacterium]MBT6511408.1 exodeoxyribonuclease III [Rhodospirillaceae bacterium]MBT7645521.1 exodeoxyribonuclease III [Rhodospirillaceae bacterium]MDG2482489.1 exodeoxyribonuclease III [Alphaproteobacteria bacterium]